MNEIEKRLNATVDILTWLDQRIAQQVEHQVEQRLALEREHWRCTVTDLIVEERERVCALLEKAGTDVIQVSNEKVGDRVQQILERSEKTLVEMGRAMERAIVETDKAVNRA
jgi:hypothetical protein